MLTPTSPSSSQLDGDSYLHLDNDPITGECYLQWEVTFTNPVGRPEILNPNFIFNTPNGLILLNEAPNQPTLVYSDGNSTLINLNNPVFGLEGLASPFEENLVATFSLSPISSSDFIFEAGSTLTYRLRFKYSYDLCANGTEGYTFLGRLVGRGRCSELEIPLNSVSDGMPPSPDAGSQCCVPVDVAVNAINACPGQNGRIVFTALNNTTLDGATVQLFDTFGPMGTQPQLTGTVQSISLSIGFYGALVTMPNGNQMSFTVNIENGEISPSFTAQSLTVCANSLFSATISDSNPLNSAPYTYSWVGPSPSTAVVCTTGSYQTNLPVPGEYSVTITNTTTGCSASHPFAIQVDMPPSQANAGANQTICSPNTALLATSPLVGTGIWSAASTSSIIFATPSSNTSQVSGLVLGQNILTWTVSNGVCPASSSTTNITVLANPNVNAGPDQSVCGTNATLAANNLQNATWSIGSGSGTFSNLNANNATVSGLSFGQNVFRWTFNNGVCPAASDEVTITAIELPTSAYAGLDQQICSTVELIQLAANQPTVGTGTWSGNVTFSNATSNNASIETIPNSGNYTLIWTTSNGNCTSIDNVLLTIKDPPQVNAGEDVITCNNNIVLGATPYSGASWSVPIGSSVSINSPSNAASIAVNLDFGDNTFNWSVNDAVCGLVSDEVIVSQVQPPIIDLVLPETMYIEQSFDLFVSPLGGVLTVNGIEYTNNFTDPITIDGAGFEPGTVTVSYTVIGETDCAYTHTETFEVVEECSCLCPDPLDQVIYIPENITSGEGIAEFFETNHIQEKCIYFSQNLTIGNALYFINCNITFGPGVKLDIRESGDVRITRSQLHGCKVMWSGIRNLGKLYIESSTVRDAQYAINMIENIYNVNGPNPYTSLFKVELSHNFVGISNEKINFGDKHDAKFKFVKFIGGNLLMNFPNQFPAAHPTNGLAGIKLNDFNSMTNYLAIDISNSFKDLTNGIILNRSLAIVGNLSGANLNFTPESMFSNIRPFQGSSQFYSGSDYYFYEGFKHSGIIATDKSLIWFIGASSSTLTEPQFLNAEPEFVNCEYGICLNRSSATIGAATLGSITQPIRKTAIVVEQPSQSQRFRILHNRIRSLKNGIAVGTSTSLDNGYSYINYNNISMLSSMSTGISLSNLPSAPPSNSSFPLKVEGNTINLLGPSTNFSSYHHGISINSAPNITLTDNLIRRKNTTSGAGILGNDIGGSTISCNTIGDWDVPGEDQNNINIPNVINKGISLYGCDHCDVISNTTSDTRVGIQFLESNSETVLQRNVMRNHGNSNFRGIGLVFGTNIDPLNQGGTQSNGEVAATFDDQSNMTNTWLSPPNSQWMLGAKKPAWYGQNIRFFVNNNNQGQINDFYPSHQPNFPNCQIDPFFVCYPGVENILPSDCDAGSTLEGYRVANNNNVISLVEKYLNNQISYDYYEPEMLYAIEKSIDAMLIDSQLTISNDSSGALAEFDALMEATSTRELNKIQKQIERFRIDSVQFATLVLKQGILDSLSQHMGSLHSQLSDSTLASDSLIWNEINAFVEQVATTKLEVETIQSQFEMDKDELLQNLRAQNNQLVALNLIEYNLKSMNELLFKKLKQDNYVFNESERSLIDQVAATCPIVGGRGVFKARGLQLSYNDSIYHDDKLLCEAQGIAYRISNSDSVKIIQELQEKMLAYPSPNTGILHILMKSSVESDYHLQLINLTGQVVIDQNNVPSNNTINLASFNLASGNYIISYKQNSSGKIFRSRIFYEN